MFIASKMLSARRQQKDVVSRAAIAISIADKPARLAAHEAGRRRAYSAHFGTTRTTWPSSRPTFSYIS